MLSLVDQMIWEALDHDLLGAATPQMLDTLKGQMASNRVSSNV